jgi:hypothetical protein
MWDAWGRANLVVPMCTLDASVVGGGYSTASLTVPMPDISAYTGATAINTAPVPTISASVVGNIYANLTVPFPTIDAHAILTPSISADLTAPMCYIHAHMGETLVTITYYGIVVNTRNYAASEYSGWDFNSFACLNGEYLGANGTGIYTLTGEHDGATDIDSNIKFGTLDLYEGTVNMPRGKKYPRQLWITHRSDGQLEVEIEGDEEENELFSDRTEITSEDMHEERIKISKGLRPRFFTLNLKNKDGSDFDLDNVSLIVDRSSGKPR